MPAPTTNLRDQILNDPKRSVALGLCVFGLNNNNYLYESEKIVPKAEGNVNAYYKKMDSQFVALKRLFDRKKQKG